MIEMSICHTGVAARKSYEIQRTGKCIANSVIHSFRKTQYHSGTHGLNHLCLC